MGLNELWVDINGNQEVTCLVDQHTVMFARKYVYQIIATLVHNEKQGLGLEGFNYEDGYLIPLTDCIIDFGEK